MTDAPRISWTSRGENNYRIGFKGDLSPAQVDIVSDAQNWWVLDEGRKAGSRSFPTSAEMQDGAVLLTFEEPLVNRRLFHAQAIEG